ncbi:Pyridoxal phosphate-dependent transferase, major region, subdomain 1 [Penicillium griseofulvum]|uniref:Pyridoxal phosphate-dependent transferase, major region, subdomain 1 n=1 Tax=Penicillium patulum TaxID=5078 RepID=A0A135LZG5_PENPA|nr:Pyridoxal phosphate-dependent transferase, major region, subdomain 1 [Penicillium griseofulvum]KXG54352.1 Pyridoxal phosphate-dependent transferase, major region, subdomain 1 [Penicillium griseofulvum]
MDRETRHDVYSAETMRETEYPMLKGETYLDHTGTTLYAQSALKSFIDEMSVSLLGNPHSDSRSSQLSTKKVEEVRKRTLEFFNADPEHFDLVFVMNATAAIKLVLDALKDVPVSQGPEKTPRGSGLWLGYHVESHTSIVGMRELANAGQHCFVSDDEVESWLRSEPPKDKSGGCPGQKSETFQVGLFAYPGQSNMTGRRLPLHWPEVLRQSEYGSCQRVFSLLDAAALAPTMSLDCFRDPEKAPDFTAVSFYKIFGFPDLGGLIVRKKSAHVLLQRSYFGGGTVEMVTCSDQPWHSRKVTCIHEALEDGTVPFHNIIALGCALTTHEQLYISQEHVSCHTTRLTARLYELLSSMRHPNGVKVCEIYKDHSATYGDSKTQGGIIAFNIRSDEGRWLSLSHIEKAANEHRIHLRTGTVCNPGGLAKILNLEQWELFQNYTAGVRCGCRSVLIGYKPSGIIRVSLGAMSTISDVKIFVRFIRDLFAAGPLPLLTPAPLPSPQSLRVHTLMVYPIEGCAAYTVPENKPWQVNSTGLQWDRQWCLVNLRTGSIVDKKEAPRILLIEPEIDFENGILRISVHHSLQQSHPKLQGTMEVPLFHPSERKARKKVDSCKYWSTVIREVRHPSYNNDPQHVHIYQSSDLATFLTNALAFPCTLARPLHPECLTECPSERPSIKHLPEVTVCSSQDLTIDQYPMPFPHKEESGQSRPKAIALMEILRVNALMYSNLASGKPQWYLLRIGRRDLDGNNKTRVIHYGSMKAIEVTAERQGPEIFEATSPVVKILWSENSGSDDDASVMDPLDRMLPVQTGQIIQV